MLEGRLLCQQGGFFLPSQGCITQGCASPRAHAVPYDLLTAASQPGSVICSVN